MAVIPLLEQDNFAYQENELRKLLTPTIAIGKCSCKLDPRSMAFIWKLVLKTLKSNHSIYTEKEISEVVHFLIHDSMPHYLELLNNPGNIPRIGKIAGFLIKVIIGLLDIKSISVAEHLNDTLINFILKLYR